MPKFITNSIRIFFGSIGLLMYAIFFVFFWPIILFGGINKEKSDFTSLESLGIVGLNVFYVYFLIQSLFKLGGS